MRRLSIVLFLLGLGCTGEIEEPQWEPPPFVFEDGDADFECGVPEGYDAPLRRLSRVQLQNTVRDLLGTLLGEDGPEVYGLLEPELDAIPTDQRVTSIVNDVGEPVLELQAGQLGFSRADQGVGQAAANAHVGLGVRLGELLSEPARLNGMGFECATNGDPADDATCIDELVRRLGELTHRRPLHTDEFEFYRDAYAAQDGESVTRAGVADLITKLVVQPNFIFHVEGLGNLTPFEAASRLSYHLWNTMPDAALLAEAESGRLLTDVGWRESIDRLIRDDRIESSVRPFLLEWFRFDQLRPISTGTGPTFEAVAGGLEFDGAFDRAVEDEIVDLFIHVLRDGGSFEDFFLSNVTTTDHPTLAAIYGIEPAADGSPVMLPESRHTVLTRVALLMARAEVAIPPVDSVTHPILRGVFLQRQISCDNIPPAPGGAMDNLPTVDRTTVGSREATTIITGSEACVDCHARINRSGFVFEGFDALGQERTEEPLFDAEGNETMRLRVNSTVDDISTGIQFARELYASGKAGTCFARHYLRFALGRPERPRPDGDGCVLREMDEAIDAGEPLRDVIAAPLLNSLYRERAETGENR